jgi:hypothetical protein
MAAPVGRPSFAPTPGTNPTRLLRLRAACSRGNTPSSEHSPARPLYDALSVADAERSSRRGQRPAMRAPSSAVYHATIYAFDEVIFDNCCCRCADPYLLVRSKLS